MPKVENTDHDAMYPWPSSVMVQGGERGTVFSRSSGNSYETAFVEAFPDHGFIRGEGETIAAAETACWEKYLTFVYCIDKSRKHGPFEARGYENGSGFCIRCGMWFDADVANMPESDAYRQDRLDFTDASIEVLAEEKWPPNQMQSEIVRRMRHRQAVRAAQEAGEEIPEFESREPMPEEEFEKSIGSEISRLLDALAGKRRVEEPESE